MQLYGPHPSFFRIQSMISKLWGKNGKIKAVTLDSGRFLFRFEDAQTLAWVMDEGPWFIDQRPMLLRRWKPRMQFEKLSMENFPIWIKLWNVPLELYTIDGLNLIASVVGEPF